MQLRDYKIREILQKYPEMPIQLKTDLEELEEAVKAYHFFSKAVGDDGGYYIAEQSIELFNKTIKSLDEFEKSVVAERK